MVENSKMSKIKKQKIKEQVISLLISTSSLFIALNLFINILNEFSYISIPAIILLLMSAKINYDNCYLIEKAYEILKEKEGLRENK